MRIALLIPVFNAAKFLPQCLDSVLAQNVPGLEIFCCDDGSTDASGKILDAYAVQDSRLHVRHRRHLGMSQTYNDLMDALPAEFDAFGIVDADDYVSDGMYALLNEAMERTGADVAECDVAFVGAENRPPDGFGQDDPEAHERVEDDLTPYWLQRTAPHGWQRKWNKLYRRAAVAGLRFQIGLDFEDDHLFAMQVNATIRRKVTVPQRLYAYRNNPDSMNGRLDYRQYVSSVALRLRLGCEMFLVTGRIPKGLEAEWCRDLVKDACRMLVRKNLRNNADAVLRRELFREAGIKLSALLRDFSLGMESLNPVQRLLCVCCLRNHYVAARLLALLT